MGQTFDRLGAVAAGILLGAGLAGFVKPTPALVATSLLVAGGLASLWLFPIDRRLALAALAAVLSSAWTWQSSLLLPTELRETLAVDGIVASLPEAQATSQRVELAVRDSSEPALIGRRVELFVPANELVTPAQLLHVQGSVLALDVAQRRRLAARGLSARLQATELAAEGLDGQPRWWLLRLRRALVDTANRIWPLPESSLAAGLAVGSRERFAPALAAAMQRTGTTHLVAVSGANVALVLYLAQRWLPVRRPRLRFGVLSALLGVFVLLTGGSASVARAGLMSWVLGVAATVGRPISPVRLLVLVAALLTVRHPLIVSADLGFQLSFLAVLGLVVLIPPLERQLPGPQGLTSLLAATLAAYLATAPLIASTFGTVSLIAPLANLAVALIALPAMVLAMVTLALGTLLPPVGSVLGWLTWPVFASLTWLIEHAAAVPGASVVVHLSPTWAIAVLAGLLMLGRWQPRPVVGSLR